MLTEKSRRVDGFPDGGDAPVEQSWLSTEWLNRTRMYATQLERQEGRIAFQSEQASQKDYNNLDLFLANDDNER